MNEVVVRWTWVMVVGAGVAGEALAQSTTPTVALTRTSSACIGASCETEIRCATSADCPAAECVASTCSDNICVRSFLGPSVRCGVENTRACDGRGHCAEEEVCARASAHLPKLECYARSSTTSPAVARADETVLRVLWLIDGLLAVVMTGLLVLAFRSVKFDRTERLWLAAKTLVCIGLLLLTCVHFYSVSSLLIGGSYMVDFARTGLVTVGMLAIGLLFGALFGLPRAPKNGDGSGDDEDRLSQVADWLTKIILGAALTQLHWLWTNASTINAFFARATGMIAFQPLGTILSVAAAICGFLLGYVSALLFLPVALTARANARASVEAEGKAAVANAGSPQA